MTTYCIHGFNVSDGGHGSVGKLRPHLRQPYHLYSYGWAGLFSLGYANRKAIETLGPMLCEGDVLIAHSNGCLIAWELAQRYADKIAAVVCINPALRRDTRWPENIRVLCLHNSTDWVVNLGRIWGRLFPIDGVQAQGWGAAGRYGFTSHQANVDNLDTSEPMWQYPVKGHSGIFKDKEATRFWGETINTWLGHGETKQ